MTHTATPEVAVDVSPEAYSQAVDCAQLHDIRLTSSSFSASSEAYLRPEPSWKRGFACDVVDGSYDKEAGLLTGWVEAEAFVKRGRRNIFLLKTKWLVVYKVDGHPDEQAAIKFVQMISNFAVYPYFRSHFACASAEAGVRLPPLPVMKEPRRKIKPLTAEDAPLKNKDEGP